MKIITATLLAHTVALVSAAQVAVRYDNTYDNPSNSLTKVACSDGEHGLIYGFNTLADIPSEVASISTISGWNSAVCGQCYSLEFEGRKIHFLGIDSKPDGVDLSERAMDRLTSDRATQLGWVMADLQMVESELCGMGGRGKRAVGFEA
ncbi:SnodProt1 [Neohortaea acidophila]|uniref:SnodProt1 n=1 Tax=Neohortaea acidophila TaxID=245834 RepID=A0A6A6PVT1_9PEZI|nr:SnodProt1 [Neohortaea acidophila]KAF2483397.1 SnodProt1 [Neohortaea acidophila]